MPEVKAPPPPPEVQAQYNRAAKVVNSDVAIEGVT